MEGGRVNQALRDLPGGEWVVIYPNGLEGRHSGKEVGRQGGELVVAEDEDLEGGETTKAGEGTRNVVVLQLKLVQLGEVSDGWMEGALEVLVAKLDSEDPVVLGAGDEGPLAWVGVGPSK